MSVYEFFLYFQNYLNIYRMLPRQGLGIWHEEMENMLENKLLDPYTDLMFTFISGNNCVPNFNKFVLH